MNRISLLLVAFSVGGCGSSGTQQATDLYSGAGGSGTGNGGSVSGSGAATSSDGGSAAGGASAGDDGGATTFDPACGPVLQKPRCLTGGWCWDAPSLLGGDLFAVDGAADGSSVWAVGAHGAAFRYCKDGWVPIETGVEANLYAVYSPAPDFALAVGEAGTVIKWDGAAWQSLPAPTESTLRAVSGTSPRNVWLGAGTSLATGANLFRFDGTTITGAGNTGGPVGAIGGRSAVDLYAGSGNETMSHWNGKAWSSTYFNTGYLSGTITKLIVGPKKRTFALLSGYGSGDVFADDAAAWRLLRENNRARSTGLFLDDAGILSVVDGTPDPLAPAVVSKMDSQDHWTESTDRLAVFPADVWVGAGKDVAIGEGGTILQRGTDGAWTQVPERAAILGTPIYLGGPSETNAYLVTEHDIYHRDAMGWHAVLPRSVNTISFATTSPEGTLYIGSRDVTTQVITFASYDGSTWTDLRKPSELGMQLFAFGPKDVWMSKSYTGAFFDGVKWFDVPDGTGCDYFADSNGISGPVFRMSPDGKVWGTGRDMVAVFDGHATCTVYRRGYETDASAIVDIGWSNSKPWAITERGELYGVEGTALTKVALPVVDAGASQSAGMVRSMTTLDGKLRYLQYEGSYYGQSPEDQRSTIVTVDMATTPPTFTRTAVPVAGAWWQLDATHTFVGTHGGVLRRVP